MYHLRSFVTEDECCAILGGYEAPKTDGCIFDLGEDRINAAKSVARRAFRHTAIDLSEELSIRALAYGLEGSMSPHVDASVGKKPKFVAILSFGAACDFYADGTLLDLRSSDVLVFDAA